MSNKLSQEMIENGWVQKKDEDGQTYIYNEKFFNEFFGEEPTNHPKITCEFIMMDINKKSDEEK